MPAERTIASVKIAHLLRLMVWIIPIVSATADAETPTVLLAANATAACAVVLMTLLERAARRDDSATVQPSSRRNASSFQSLLEDIGRYAELLGRLVARLSFPVAEQKWRSMPVAKPIHLFVKNAVHLAHRHIIDESRRHRVRGQLSVFAPSSRSCTRLQ
jgi:hypothetical protein